MHGDFDRRYFSIGNSCCASSRARSSCSCSDSKRRIAAADEYSTRDTFDLVVLATKAAEVALRLLEFLGPGGTLAPIQNGGVPQMLTGRLGDNRVLGGLSNLGATMTVP